MIFSQNIAENGKNQKKYRCDKHSVFKTVYVSVYKKLDSSMPWVYGMVYETSYFISKLHKLFNLLDTLLLSTFEEIIWSESDS